MDATIRTEVTGPVLTLVLDRPAKRNPLAVATYREIADALQAADADPAIRCAVLTGAGDAFCSGGELGGEPHETAYDWYVVHEEITRQLARVREARTPVIAAVNGLCLGSGVILAAHCDLVVASDRATFGFVETRMGLAGIGMMAFLIGPQWAKFLALSGEVISAQQAREIGLVLAVVDDERFPERVAALAERISATPPIGAVLNKRNVNATVDAMGWQTARGFNQSHYPVIDAMAPWAETVDGRRLADIMRDEGFRAMRDARDAPFREPWLDPPT